MRASFHRMFIAALTLVLVVAACAGSGSSPTPPEAREAATDGTATAPSARVSTTTPTTGGTSETTAAEDDEPLAIDLRVVSGSGGVFAFAKVFINGKGPFAFTVDTGASRSVLDWDLVKRVGIDVVGEPVEITGITCRGEAGRVRVRKWRVGGVGLPAAEIQTVDMPEPRDGTEIDGLLGSDILSQFGTITVDYEAERMTLRRGAA